jgi:hypothetical protein
MGNKRLNKRYMKRLDAEFIVDGLSFKAIAAKLSESGLFLRTQQARKEGVVVDIKVYLSEHEYCTLRGIVKHSRKERILRERNGMGIEILEKDAKYMDLISGLKEKD